MTERLLNTFPRSFAQPGFWACAESCGFVIAEKRERVLGVFAKAPRPGEVKSRLAHGIGAESAAVLYDAFLRDLLPRIASVPAHRVLAYGSPADRDYFLNLCCGQFELEVQAGSDLGARIAAFFQTRFSHGADRVVLVGSDSPDLPIDRIDQAFRLLAKKDAVIGPSEDGGYYLIALRRPLPELFRGIDWSTPSVLDQTIRKMSSLAASCAMLETWYDIDLPADLPRLAAAIESARSARSGQLRHTERIYERIMAESRRAPRGPRVPPIR